MVAEDGRPSQRRDWDAVPEVVRARALIARDRLGAALGEAWKAASLAARTDDEHGLAVVGGVAREIEERASGRTQRRATILRHYVEHCGDAAASGAGNGSLLTRLFGLADRKRPPTKTCPECAEPVREQARVCRFCGHRFDDA